MSLAQRLLAEAVGTTALLATVVGSGIMGTQLAAGNDAIALLANAAATAGVLYVAIVDTRATLAYVGVQCVAAIAGVVLAHAMFDLPLLQPGTHARTGAAQWLSEAVATCGLLLTILLGLRARPAAIPALVAAYIFAAYWFTASTSFANPAVTLARALTQTFAGIRPIDAPGFIVAQLVGTALALLLAAWLERRTPAAAG